MDLAVRIAEHLHRDPGQGGVGGGAVQQPVEDDIGPAHAARAGEGQEVLEHPLEVVRFVADLGEVVGHGLLVRAPFDEGQVARQGGEAVAQLVRDTAGHLAEAGKTLGEPAVFRRAPRGGQVGEEDEETADAAVRPAQGVDGEADGQRISGAGAHAALRPGRRAAGGDGSGQKLAELRLAGQGLRQVRARGRRRIEAEEPGAHCVQGEHRPFPVEQQEAALQAWGQRALEGGDVIFDAVGIATGERPQRLFERPHEEMHLIPLAVPLSGYGSGTVEERLVRSHQMAEKGEDEHENGAFDAQDREGENRQGPPLPGEQVGIEVDPDPEVRTLAEGRKTGHRIRQIILQPDRARRGARRGEQAQVVPGLGERHAGRIDDGAALRARCELAQPRAVGEIAHADLRGHQPRQAHRLLPAVGGELVERAAEGEEGEEGEDDQDQQGHRQKDEHLAAQSQTARLHPRSLRAGGLIAAPRTRRSAARRRRARPGRPRRERRRTGAASACHGCPGASGRAPPRNRPACCRAG